MSYDYSLDFNSIDLGQAFSVLQTRQYSTLQSDKTEIR